MMTFFACILPIILASELNIPVTIDEDGMTVRMRHTFTDQNNSISTQEDDFRIILCNFSLQQPQTIARSGNNGVRIRPVTHPPVLTMRPTNNVGFLNGMMLVAGSSMVVNPLDTARYCEDGSLFYVNSGPTEYIAVVKPSIVYSNNPQDVGAQSISYLFGFDSSSGDIDYLPPDFFDEILNVLIPNRMTDQVPEILDNCDLVNGRFFGNEEFPHIIDNCNYDRFPSIYFKIGEYVSRDSDTIIIQPLGTIVYGPDDYLSPMANGRCRVMIRHALGMPYFGLNFLKRVAVHFNKTSITFCDPANL
jgi:hypothetical protein